MSGKAGQGHNLTSITDGNRQPYPDLAHAESGTQCGLGTGNQINEDNDGADHTDDGCPNTIYTYDNADRLTSVLDALGHKTTYSYDGNGDLAAVTNANRQTVNHAESGTNQCGPSGTGNGVDNDPQDDGNPFPPIVDDGCPSTTYGYDALNRVQSTTDALGRVTSYLYDAASNLTKMSDPRGIDTYYTPDALNRLHLIEYKFGTTLKGSTTYDYDDAGNRKDMIDYDAATTTTQTINYAYDVVNRLTQVDVTYPASKTVKYSYDTVGNISQVTYPGTMGYVTYGYNDKNHQITSVQQSWGSVGATSYEYWNDGSLKKTTLPNGVLASYMYDTADRLTSVANTQSGPMSTFTYTLDEVGNRTQVSGTNPTQTYQYDALYRLTQAAYSGGPTDNYIYDANGNRTYKNSTSYANDAADQLTSIGSTNYIYDPNGAGTVPSGSKAT